MYSITSLYTVPGFVSPTGPEGVGAMGRRGARRSQSLLPEGASEVRRAGYSLSLRQGGFKSLVLGEGLDLAAQHDLAAAFGQDIPVTSPSTLPRRKNSKTKAGVSMGCDEGEAMIRLG